MTIERDLRFVLVSTASEEVLWELPCPIEERVHSLCAGPDLTGDGQFDVFVGSEKWPTRRGAVAAFDGQDGSMLWLSAVESSGVCEFGSRVYALPDIDGDGLFDVLGAAEADGMEGDSPEQPFLDGMLRAISAADGRTLWELRRPCESMLGTSFGDNVCRIPDQDGDGIDDLAATEALEGGRGARGRLLIVSAKSGEVLRTVAFPFFCGTSLSFVDDHFVIGGGIPIGDFGDDGFVGKFTMTGEMVWGLRGTELVAELAVEPPVERSPARKPR